MQAFGLRGVGIHWPPNCGDQGFLLNHRRPGNCLAYAMVAQGKADKTHYKKHRSPGTCILCTWQKNSPRWPQALPAVIPEWGENTRPEGGVDRSWVRIRKGGKGHYRAYCMACKSFRTGRRGLELQDLKRHHDSAGHKRAVMDLFGLSLGPHAVSISTAPPYDEFATVWKGGLDSKHNVDIACIHKCGQMRECLFEAICNARRQFLSKAETIMILRDESKGYLLIRAMACDSQFNHMVFLLGLRSCSGGDAVSIKKATNEIIDEFCKPIVPLPGDLKPEDLAARSKLKLEGVCVDSASIELRAPRLMMQDVAPNLKVIVRDHAHATAGCCNDHGMQMSI